MEGIDSSVPHSARIWNYWLSGRDNYPADRRAGDEYVKTFPGIVDIARADRNFLGRTVRYMVREAGIRQFLDIGTGLPTADNTHEVAQRAAASSRVVYVDNDPLVLAHARALLRSTSEGATYFVDADMAEPETIVELAGRLLDLGDPVGLTFMGVLGHIASYEKARSIVKCLLAELPAGSHLAINDGTDTSVELNEAQKHYNASGAVPYHLRTTTQIEGFFEGLELVEPGVVSVPLWRPDVPYDGPEIPQYGGVARKP